MDRISAVIVAKDESQKIGRCLEAAFQVADEVMVIDTGSKDDTVKVALKAGARVVVLDWEGFGKTKNKANDLAANDWILSLDADEVLSPELIESLKKEKKELKSVFAFNRLTNYCGFWIHYCGWHPEWKPRLFNRKQCCWDEKPVHEELIIPPGLPQKKSEGLLLHYSIDSIEDHLSRIDRYTGLAAEELYKKGDKFSIWGLIFKPLATFVKMYCLKQGFRDGYAGLQVCLLSSYARFIRQLKLNQFYLKKGV